MFKVENFISQKPSVPSLCSLKYHVTLQIHYTDLTDNKNRIIQVNSLSLPYSASVSHDSPRCASMNINKAVATFDWQTLRGLINIQQQFHDVSAQSVLSVKARSAYRRTGLGELLHTWCISPWTFCTTVNLWVIRVKRSTRKTCATQRRGEKITLYDYVLQLCNI